MRYTREDGCRAWLTYAQARPDILCNILEAFGTAEKVYDQLMKDRGKCLRPYLPQAQIDLLRERAAPDAMHDMMVVMQREQMGVIGMDDIHYPEAFRQMNDPPAILFYQGDPDCLMGKCISIIGTRKASPNTIEATRKIARELSNSGVTIISGLAVGIDSAAHQGCLAGSSPTAGLMACGLDVDYPIESGSLKKEIIMQGGVLLSEYPPGCPALSWHFQFRNRLIAALGKAVVMMEGRIRSGSMLTVQHALDQGKDVYAYPGNIGSEWAEGAHQLLREGALYFTSAQDILEDMHWESDAPAPTPKEKESLPPMNDKQRQIYALLCRQEMSFDELAASTGFDAPTLSGELTMLTILGYVKALPGKTFQKV